MVTGSTTAKKQMNYSRQPALALVAALILSAPLFAQNPTPTLTSVFIHLSVPAGSQTTTIELIGTGFVTNSVVNWNGKPVPGSSCVPPIPNNPPSPGTCWANIAASQLASPGTGSVTVVNPAPGGGTSNALLVQVTTPNSNVTLKDLVVAPITIALGNPPVPYDLVTADFDKDGVPDTAVIYDGYEGDPLASGAATRGNIVRIQLGSGTIFTTFVPTSNAGTGLFPRMIAGDVNGDGYPDLIVMTPAGVYILLNDHTGNCPLNDLVKYYTDTRNMGSPYGTVSFGDQASAIAAGDFNNDGKLDLAVTLSYTPHELAILTGKGDGTFTLTKSGSILGSPDYDNVDAIAVGDFNLDGNLDLALCDTNGFKVLAGDGKGNFSTALYSDTGGFAVNSSSIVVSDFNSDGLSDIAYYSYATQLLGILLGEPNGKFKAVNPIVGINANAVGTDNVLPNGTTLVVGDFDGDGKYDLALGGDRGPATLLLGNGDGTFNQSTLAEDGWNGSLYRALAVADFNGDGRLDLVMGATKGSAASGNNYSVVTFVQTPIPQYSPTSLSFGNQRVNTKSVSQTVTVTNAGSGVLFIASFGLPAPPFLLTGGTCLSGPGYLEGNSQCTLNIAFQPFDLTPHTNGPPMFLVTLSGTGVAAQISVSPGSLTFSGSQSVGSASAAQNVTLKNVGTDTLNMNISINNNFTMNTSACGSALAPGVSCIIPVSFQPTVTGPIAGLLTIAGDAINAPQSVALQGNGAAPAAAFSVSSLNFGGNGVKAQSNQPVTVTNNGTLPLTIGSLAITGPNASDFSYAHNCTSQATYTPNLFPITVAVSQSCLISVTFQPGAAGPRSASLVFYDTALNSPQSIALSGSGWANPLPLVTQALTPAALTAGSSTPEIIRVNGAGFLTDSVVQWNGKPLVTRVPTGNTALAFVPPNLMSAASSGWITVVNPAPAGGASNAVPITIGTPSSNMVTNRADLAAGAGPQATAIADFNGDGAADMVVLNSDGTLSMFLGDGKGGLTLQKPIALPVGGPIAIATADFNLDGKADLAVANSGNNTVNIMLGDGTGNFTAGPSVATSGQTLVAIAAGDFNRDGIPDVAAVGSGNGAGVLGTLTVLLGDGTGGLSSFGSPASPGNFADAIVTADFNGDGYLDLAVVALLDNTLKIYLGDGNGNFTITGPIGARDPVAIAVGDFNNDGVPDLAIAAGGFIGGQPNHYVNVLLGDGKGGFPRSVAITTGANPLGLVAGDFNNDGKMDLATANFTDNTVSIFLGDGTGNFTSIATPPAGAGPRALGAADFNGDGLLDLVSVNSNANSVSVFLQQSGTPEASTPPNVIWSNGPGLTMNQQLTSLNGMYRAQMQSDGNFVVYGPSGATWASNTNGQGLPPYALDMQSDGNLVVYATLNTCAANTPCNPTWASHTNGVGVGPYTLILQNDGNLVVYDGSMTPLWSSGGTYTNLTDRIQSNGIMGISTNQQLVSASGSWRAIMQTDGNFVVYGPSGPNWASGTNAKGAMPFITMMQPDGNLVVYANTTSCAPETACSPTWASGTNGKGTPPFTLIMQNDGNLVVYDSTNAALWASLSSH
jgi:FG-GAP-like repeat/Cep192 domain 4/FG-GAP repeat